MTRLRDRRAVTVVAAAALAVLLLVLLAPAPAAQAAQGRLEFSRDGSTWTSAPPEALFDESVVLVPGSSVTAALHVRSTAETTGVLRTSVTNVRTSGPEAEEHFGLRARTGAGRGLDRTRIADLEEGTLLGPPLTLEPGQSAAFTLTIDLELRPSGTGAQNSAIGLDLAISFTDADADAGGSGEPGEPGEPGGFGGDVTEELGSPTILPVLPPGEDDDRSADTHGDVAPAGGTSEGPRTPAETVRAGTESGGTDRGFLAVTGIARSALVAAVAVTLLGAVLRLASRTRRDLDRSEASGS